MPFAFAQNVYKCQTDAAAVWYQDKPCPPDMQTLPELITSETAQLDSKRKVKKPKKYAQKLSKTTIKLPKKKQLLNTAGKKQKCLSYSHRITKLKQELKGALRPKKREKLDLDLKNAEQQLELCQK